MKLARHDRDRFLLPCQLPRELFLISGRFQRNPAFLRHSSCLNQVADSNKNMDGGKIRLHTDVCQTKVSLLTNKRVSRLCD